MREEFALAFDQAFSQDLFVAEPQIGDVGGAEAEDVFEGATHFTEMEIHANALEQFDQLLRTHGLNGFRPNAVVIQPVKGYDVKRLGAGTVAINVQETPGFRLGRGKPRCHS